MLPAAISCRSGFQICVRDLSTSVIAAWRKHTEISVGNVVGSNIFNIFGILGVTALIAPSRAEVAISEAVIAGWTGRDPVAAFKPLPVAGEFDEFTGALPGRLIRS